MKVSGASFRETPLRVLKAIDAATDGALSFEIDGLSCVYVNDPRTIEQILVDEWQSVRKEFGYRKAVTHLGPELFSARIQWLSSAELAALEVMLRPLIERHLLSVGPIADAFSTCKRLSIEIFAASILKGCVAQPIEVLESHAHSAIKVLSNIALQFPANVDTHDDLGREEADALDSYKCLFSQGASPNATVGRSMTTLIAGYEQLSTAIFWTVAHHAKQPLAMLDGAGRKNYINEVLRLHAPTWTIMRRCKRAIDVGTLQLQPGQAVITSPWIMARKESFFPNPEEFDPSRWQNPASQRAFFPFGHGPRVCKGERFVRSVLYALLGVLSRYTCQMEDVPHDDEAVALAISHTPGQHVIAMSVALND